MDSIYGGEIEMTWLQILAQAAIFATFIGAFIAIAAYFNGKHIKEGVGKIEEMIWKIEERMGRIGEMIGKIGEMIKETQNLIVTEMKETRNLIVTEQMENRKLMEKMGNRMEKTEKNTMEILGRIYDKVA